MSIIGDTIQKIRIIDGHEHLIPQWERKKHELDFFGLLHYLESDLISAGMKRGILDRQSSLTQEEKARQFMTYWPHTSNTTYARMLRTAMEDLYGFRDWTAEGIVGVSKQVRERSMDDGWYRTVLRDRSGIDLSFTLVQTTQVDFELFRPIMFLDFTFKLRSRKDIHDVERQSGMKVHKFHDYLTVVDALLHRFKEEGMVATKLGHAYWRSLAITKPAFHDAEAVFNRLMQLSLDESMLHEQTLALQDYLIHYIVQRSTAYGLPIQIHTGHHETSVSGNGNIVTHSQVTHLIPLLLEYEETNFVLLHAGFPYHQEYVSIVKNFPNAYADMTWVYIISPTASKQILHQLIEMVPQRKIHGFGGDYNFVEGTYAHQKLARQLLTAVLTEKVAEGAWGEDEAIRFAECVLRDNLIDFYQLKDV